VTVSLTETLGAEVVAHFDVDAPAVATRDTLELAADIDAPPPEQASFTARLHPRTAVRAGRPATLVADVERLHLFDPATGQALR
jgi:multiple sugar transport system ATP-binding protein